MSRVAILGLDAAPPSIVFERLRGRLPVLGRLMGEGAWGPLRSVTPPITCPAWLCAATGRDPGALGLYGFRNRADRSYAPPVVADSRSITTPALWDLAGAAGLDSLVIGVPPTWPPPRLRGALVSCFLTPDGAAEWTHPPELRREIESVIGAYAADVSGFRGGEPSLLLAGLHAMMETRFRLARRLLATRPWNLFMMVEIGVDRVQHAFWRHADPAHPRHVPGSSFADAVDRYYIKLDREIGDLLETIGPDAHVAVVSDHGARPLEGAIAVNDWLVREGYLALTSPPPAPAPLERAGVRWARTRAWAYGGYYARVYLNVRGREPQGTVAPADFARVRDDLARRLAAIPDPHGRPLATRVLRPEEVWPCARGVPPDLLVFFGDLAWRAAGTVGHASIHLPENDTGPDDVNHDWDGIFIWRGPGVAPGGPRAGLRLVDLAPTALAALGLPVPEDIEGRAMRLQ